MNRINSLWLTVFLLFSTTLPATTQDENVKSLQANDPEQHFNRGLEHYKAGRLKDAIVTFNQAIKLNPKEAELSYYLGEAYYSSEMYVEAIKAYKQALKLKPIHSAARNNLGMAYLKVGQFEQAVESFNETIRREPEYFLAHYDLGAAYLERGNLNAALERLMILRTINPKHAKKLNTLLTKSGKAVSNAPFNGKALVLPEPNYSRAAKLARASGMVAVIFTIDEAGKVISAHAMRGHPLLQEAAIKSALKSRFTPIMVNGRAMKVTGIINYDFKSGEKPHPQLPSYVLHF